MSWSLQAREWREALRIAALFGRQDLIETTVAPQAADSASTLMVGFPAFIHEGSASAPQIAEVLHQQHTLNTSNMLAIPARLRPSTSCIIALWQYKQAFVLILSLCDFSS